MIKKPGNWNSVQEFTDRPRLPLGAYVTQIVKGTVVPSDFGEQLCILFDISEGEHKDYFKKDFETSTLAVKKWKGVLRLWLPKDDGSEKDEWTKRTLKGFTTAVEKSNPGYVWDWNEETLAGKALGVLFRNEQWEYEGKTGWAVRPFRALSVDSVRSGDFQLPKEKPLASKAEAPKSSLADLAQFGNVTFAESEDEDLPF